MKYHNFKKNSLPEILGDPKRQRRGVEGSVILLQGVLADDFFKTFKPAKTAPVFVLEGRPDLSAGKGNSAALVRKGIVPTVICDNMAGFLFFKGLVKEVVLACQFADKSGALCDMGGLILAVLAKRHKVSIRLGPAKHKVRFLGNPEDILSFEGQRTAPKGVSGYVPLVEWVPAKYLTMNQDKRCASGS